MSGAPTQSDGVPLRDFLQLREALTTRRTGSGGRDVCRRLTSSLDGAVASLVAEFDGPGVALVAIGGYGRAELSVFSDVDLMILHEVDDPSDVAAAVFRPLWDAGLRLGHAVRTVREAAAAARDRFDTYTTLLTSRLVAGDRELFERLTSEIATVTRARPLRRYLVSEELERRRRDPYLVMAVDVKEGRGGLRTLQAFEWERRREALIGRFSRPQHEEEGGAYQTLMSIRNALHATAGRQYDVYSFDLREPVARWLGSDVYDVGESLVHAMQTADRLANQRWPELIEGRKGRSARGRSRLRSREPIVVQTADLTWGDLAALLRAGERGRSMVQRLEELGGLDEMLPEWSRVRDAPQLAPFHEHPVAAHLWRTVDEMQRLVDGDDGHYSAIATELDSPDLLTLVAFLHDIGKGQGGEHARVGADIARRLCGRLGCGPGEATLVEQAVLHHLLLSEAATRRDLDDPAVIADVAETVGDLRLLQVLYLLTVADSKATGKTMWGDWKATLVRTLFVRCAAHFGADRVQLPGTTLQEALAEADPERREAVAAHLEAMPEEYMRSTPADEVLWHLDLLEALSGKSNLGTRSGDPVESAVVVGQGRPGFRRLVAESFAANGIDVLEARLTTRSDGIVVDTFRVRDDRTGDAISSAKWVRLGADVEAALAGDLDTESKVAARAEAYSSVTGTGVACRVEVSLDEASGDGVITIKCSDRIGRLAEILTVLRQCGLDIRLAKLESRSGEVVDTFHVSGEGLPTDPVQSARLERRIEASIRA